MQIIRMLQRPHTEDEANTTKVQCMGKRGEQREKRTNDLGQALKLTIQVRESPFLYMGYYVGTAGKNAMKIKEDIKNQLQENLTADQITRKEIHGPVYG